jgi:hypothetical protein
MTDAAPGRPKARPPRQDSRATRKYRGIVFVMMHRRETIEYAAVLDPADENKRIALRVSKKRKGKSSWSYQVVGAGISEAGVREFLNDAFDAATSIALARAPEGAGA